MKRRPLIRAKLIKLIKPTPLTSLIKPISDTQGVSLAPLLLPTNLTTSGGATKPCQKEQSRETFEGSAAKVQNVNGELLNFNPSPPQGKTKNKVKGKNNTLPYVSITKASNERLKAEIKRAGLWLTDTQSQTQRMALVKVLQYLGARGLAISEAKALDYLSVPPRVHELRELGYIIHTKRENAVIDGGHIHRNTGRYILIALPPTTTKQGGK